MFSVEELVIQHRTQKVTVVNVKKRVTPTGRADGMGILFMGYESVFCKKLPPWMRKAARTPATNTNLDDSLDDDTAASSTCSNTKTSTALMPNFGLGAAMQTVLDTGAIKLMRSTHANTARELRQQVTVPMWVFTNTGPNVYYPQIENTKEIDGDDTSAEYGAKQDGGQFEAPVPINKSSEAPIDLNTCRQFSVVHYEDLADPKKSMVMIQTPEQKSIHDVDTGLHIRALPDSAHVLGGTNKIQELESELDSDDVIMPGVSAFLPETNGGDVTLSSSDCSREATCDDKTKPAKLLANSSHVTTATRDQGPLHVNAIDDGIVKSKTLPQTQVMNFSLEANLQREREVKTLEREAKSLEREAKILQQEAMDIEWKTMPERQAMQEKAILDVEDIYDDMYGHVFERYIRSGDPRELKVGQLKSISDFFTVSPIDECGELSTRCRADAHAQGKVAHSVSPQVATLSEFNIAKTKAKLADSGLYQPNDVSTQSTVTPVNSSHDVDSGIWDMIQGRDCDVSSQCSAVSSRGSTPGIMTSRLDDPKHVQPLVSDIKELALSDMIPSHPLQMHGNKPSIAYRAFKVDADAGEVTLSKARLATYVPLLEDASAPAQLATSAKPAIETISEHDASVAIGEVQVREVSDGECDALTENLLEVRRETLALLSESDEQSTSDAFETAPEYTEGSDVATDATPTVEDISDDWCVVDKLEATAAASNETADAVRMRDAQPITVSNETTDTVRMRDAQPITDNKPTLDECTQTSPVEDEPASKTKRDDVTPRRRHSVTRQRSYAQAIRIDNDVTSPESESGWYTAHETPYEPLVKPKMRVKKRSRGDADAPARDANTKSLQEEYSTSSEIPSSTGDERTSSTESSSTPVQSPTSPSLPTSNDVTSRERTVEANGFTDINVSYDVTSRERAVEANGVRDTSVTYDVSNQSPVKLVSDIANVMDLNFKHQVSDNEVESKKSTVVTAADKRRPKFMSGSPSKTKEQKVFTKAGEGVGQQQSQRSKGFKDWFQWSSDVKARDATPRSDRGHGKEKSSTKVKGQQKSTHRGKDTRDGNITHDDTAYRRLANNESNVDDVIDVTPTADEEERELMTCGTEDLPLRIAALNPFDKPVLATSLRPKKADGADVTAARENSGKWSRNGSAVTQPKLGIASIRSPTIEKQSLPGGCLGDVKTTRVASRLQTRPNTVVSGQGVGLNQFATSSPKAQRKPAFNFGLLSPSGSASSDDHSPRHKSAAASTTSQSDTSSSYLMASYNDGTDWGDESFLWDADSDSDDTAYATDVDVSACDYEPHSDWMSELPERLHGIPLTSLAIPGAHISFAIERDMKIDMDIAKSNYEMAEFLRKLPNLSIFNNFRSLIKQIWKAWMPKQMLSVTQQLRAGIRYFDIRVTKFRSALYAEHGLYSRQLIKYLKEIKCYLDLHPKEVVLLHFEALNQIDTKDKRRLVTCLFQIFGAKMAKVTSEPSKVTLDILWRRRKQVLIILPSEDVQLLHNHVFAGLVWPDSVLSTQTPKAKSKDELKTFLNSSYYNMHVMRASRDSFQVTRAVMSPDMTMLFGEYEFQSMRQLTLEETHPCIADWIRHKSNLNIVAFDFVGASNLIGSILKLNDSKFIQTVV